MLIKEAVLDDAQIIIGSTIDDSRQGEISITVIATGFDLKSQPAAINQQKTEGIMGPNIETLFPPLDMPTFGMTDTPTSITSQPQPKPFNTNIEIPPFLKK